MAANHNYVSQTWRMYMDRATSVHEIFTVFLLVEKIERLLVCTCCIVWVWIVTLATLVFSKL